MPVSQEGESEIGVGSIQTKSGGKGSSEQELQIGTEIWFAEVVGLPNWGINPLRDLSHVQNGNLLEVF